MKMEVLLVFTGIAMIRDLRTGKIPNGWIVTGLILGLCMQLAECGAYGMVSFAAGSSVMVGLLAVLFYFRMLGAGDIKLLAVVGGFLGVSEGITCMAAAFVLGAFYSIILLWKRGIFRKRFQYFFAYIGSYFQTGQWKPYRQEQGKEAEFCFSIPVFLSIIFMMVR